jgi:hypothetical protein
MLFGYFILFVALAIETVGAYYSVSGLAAIFSGALIPILIMGASLEVGKVTAAVWLKMYWDRASATYKLYLVPAVAFLMLLTSMGIFGFLSKAHSDQSLVSGDVQSKIAIYDEKIKTARENIESDRKQLKQMDEAVDQVMVRSSDEKGADKANAIRRSQSRDRVALARDIEANQKLIATLNDEAAPIRAEVRKVEADVGPIKYIAALIYGDNPDANILERSVRWVIILIVAVFDPLALVLILAAQQTLRWVQEDQEADESTPDPYVADVGEPPTAEEVAAIEQHYPYESPPESEHKPEPEPESELSHADVQKIWDMWGPTSDPVAEPEPVVDVERRKFQPPPPEVGQARGRGVIGGAPTIRADNTVQLDREPNSSFGTEFPAAPEKGDLYLRVDILPNRLYKYNGSDWIMIDKSQTDVYSYDEAYLRYLVDEIAAGRYDADTLSESEQTQIKEYLARTQRT